MFVILFMLLICGGCCSVTQSCQLFSIPWTAALHASLSLTISWSLPKFVSIVLVMSSNHLNLWCLLLLLPSILPSIRAFSNELAFHIRWPKYWSFNFSFSPSNEYSGLVSLKIDYFDLLAVQRALMSLLQHHNLKASILELCLLNSPAPKIICDHWEDHSLDYTDLCWQSDVFAFQHHVLVCHSFPAKKQSSDFTAAVTIHCDFRAPKEKICYCIHLFPF